MSTMMKTTITLCLVVAMLIVARNPARCASPTTGQLLLATTAVIGIDWKQSQYIAKHPDEYYEINPLLGKHPSVGRVDRHFLVCSLANAALICILPRRARREFQGIALVGESAMVVHNFSIGIKF